MADTYTFSIVVLILHFFFFFFFYIVVVLSVFLDVRTVGLCSQLLRGLLKI